MFTRLLVPLDRSTLGEQALSRAAELARGCNAAVDIVLVHHSDQYPDYGGSRGLQERQLETEEQYVSHSAGEVARSAGVPTTHAVLRGDVVSAIVARAGEIGADLIVMTSHGRTGLSRAWLGSVADGVIRRSSIPVLMLRPASELATPLGGPAPFRKILVPVDGSRDAMSVLAAAASLARLHGARLVLLRIILPVPFVAADPILGSVYPATIQDTVATAEVVDDAKRQLDDAARSIVARDGIDVEVNVLVADGVAQALLDFASASSADLIAMSTHSRGASRLLIGSLADKIIRGSRLPVLLYHASTEIAAVPPPTSTAEQCAAPLFGIA
ncbi:MAG: universal stress protein [Gemmatimonadaceae bacterium]